MEHLAPCLALLLVTAGCGSSADSPAPDQPSQDDATTSGEAGNAGIGGSKTSEGNSGASGAAVNVVAGSGGNAGSGSNVGLGGNAGSAGNAGSGGNLGSGGKSDAGSTGTGGATSDAGTPPHTVLPCAKVGAIGQWEDVTPPGGALASGSITQAFVVDPVHAGTVYLGWGHGGSTPTDQTGVWKTTDCGATWAHVSTGTNGKDVDSAGHWAMAIDFVDPQVLYTANGYGTSGVFKSTNGGVDWKQMFPADIAVQFIYGGFVERITMDPTDHLHLIVSPHFTCADGKSCLAETKDGGTTWRVLRGTPDSGEDSGQMMIDSKIWLWGSTFDGLYRTADGGGSWTKVSTGNSSDSLYRAKDGSYYVANPFGVLHSTDTITWTKIPNSPGGRAITGDGTTLFTSNRNDSSMPYYSAPESNPATWAPYAVSAKVTKGGWIVGYDTDHHILYSSTESKGLWRVVTK